MPLSSCPCRCCCRADVRRSFYIAPPPPEGGSSNCRRPLLSLQPRLPIPVFRNSFFGPPKPVPARIPEDIFLLFFFFFFFSGGISSQERGFGGVLKIPVFSRFHRNSLQEFLRDQNSCICTGFLRIPPDSSGFLFPPKAVWLRPVTKEGSLLSNSWTKIDLF